MPAKDWVSSKIEIRKTAGKGRGTFAVGEIKAGEPLIIFGGEYTDSEGAKRARLAGKLAMQWGDDLGHFINYSCDPNAWMKDVFTIVAKRNIKIGEEITTDYALWEADENYISKWECKCDSPICRKKVTCKDWRLPELQERYKNHFSPLINKKIKAIKNAS